MGMSFVLKVFGLLDIRFYQKMDLNQMLTKHITFHFEHEYQISCLSM